MSDEYLSDRRKSLEEQFFARQNQKLIEEFRKQREQLQKREALAAASGIANQAVLEKLLATGIEAESLAALSLFPLVAVAWADGKLDEDEARAVLKVAEETGITPGSESRALLAGWLEEAPGEQVLAAWKDYVSALRDVLDDAALQELREEVLGRARRVAQAAGGILGLMAVSAAEEAKLGELERAFHR